MQRKVSFDHHGDPVEVYVQTDRYAVNGNLAVQLIDADDGGPYATVSVNVEGVRLSLNEFVFKTYSENEGLLGPLLEAGVVELTGRDTDLGPVCRLADHSVAPQGLPPEAGCGPPPPPSSPGDWPTPDWLKKGM